MKAILRSILYSFPVQLMLLHLRKQQLLLAFWVFLAGAMNGSIMRSFGADSLLLAPEYMGQVNYWSGLFTGLALGVFIMSWNITSFLFFSNHFKFLAATSKPFRNYTINNLSIPILFLIFYFTCLIQYEQQSEMMRMMEIITLPLGILSGLFVFILLSFAYIAGTEKAIHRTLLPGKSKPTPWVWSIIKKTTSTEDVRQLHVESYFAGFFKIRKPREVFHYNRRFVKRIFERNHVAAFLAIIFAFFLLMNYGYFLDMRVFQLPAAASILLFFSILISATGAFVYWLRGWSIIFIIMIGILISVLVDREVIDMRNKAFGLNYQQSSQWPEYSLDHLLSLSDQESRTRDSLQMIGVLNRWKEKQAADKPYLYLLSASGGGLRSAAFTFHAIRSLDSVMKGDLMKKIFLYSGASGGMLGTTYYRELYRRKNTGSNIDPMNPVYGDYIGKDLLNPIFSALVTRDLVTPSQYFSIGPCRYVKDRAFAFEEQFNANTGFILNGRLQDYRKEEQNAAIPLGLYLSTITQDGRKLMVCTQPVSFLMRPSPDSSRGITAEPDAIDYVSFFSKQNPYNLRLLTALRMNATFPYVLPNVWLPSRPVIDVMDAGMRDNYGQEMNFRFMYSFKKWIRENTSGVILLQIRDHIKAEKIVSARPNGLTDIFFKPLEALQNNIYYVQDYYQESMLSYLSQDVNIRRFVFMYDPPKNLPNAALNFHLTAEEKRSVIESLSNQQIIGQLKDLQILNNQIK
jgi:hypothetical protein